MTDKPQNHQDEEHEKIVQEQVEPNQRAIRGRTVDDSSTLEGQEQANERIKQMKPNERVQQNPESEQSPQGQSPSNTETPENSEQEE